MCFDQNNHLKKVFVLRFLQAFFFFIPHQDNTNWTDIMLIVQKMSTRDKSYTIGMVQGSLQSELIMSWHLGPEEADEEQKRRVYPSWCGPKLLWSFEILWLGCEVELLSWNVLWIQRKRWRHVPHRIRREGGRKGSCFAFFFRCRLRFSWPVDKGWEDFKVLWFESRFSIWDLWLKRGRCL